jgi:CheY-like chemotaxis protein
MKKILIIDDDAVFQKTMSEKLKLLTYEVVSALDGEDGYHKATVEKPDLMLVDINMPKLDGISLLKRLKENKDLPRIPALITSNLSAMDNISEGISLGVKGYIIKSDETLDTIVKEVNSILNS